MEQTTQTTAADRAKQRNKAIAGEILSQLGGNRFIMFTGSKNFVAVENGLKMHLADNTMGAMYLTITLTAMDDYTLEFSKLDREIYDIVILKTINGVYCEDLQRIFTRNTGLYTCFNQVL